MTFERRLTDQASCSNGIGSVLDQFAKRNRETIGTAAVELLAAESAHKGRNILYVYGRIGGLPASRLDVFCEFFRVACTRDALASEGSTDIGRSACRAKYRVALLELLVELVNEIKCKRSPPSWCLSLEKRCCGRDDQCKSKYDQNQRSGLITGPDATRTRILSVPWITVASVGGRDSGTTSSPDHAQVDRQFVNLTVPWRRRVMNACSCLTLILACIVYWQAREISRLAAAPDFPFDPDLLRHVSPIEWKNVILYGEIKIDPSKLKRLC